MANLNDNINKIIKAIITITLYFIWPTIISKTLNIFGMGKNSYGTFIGNMLLFVIFFAIYYKDIIFSIKKQSIKKNICLLLVLIVVQILTNLISVSIVGMDNYSSYVGVLPSFLNKWPILMTINMVIYYPVVESLVFSKTFKDTVNNKWTFIICSSLFFWLVNLSAFSFNYMSIIATLSCFTTSIVINYFYYKEDNISSIIIVKMIYNLIFLLLP